MSNVIKTRKLGHTNLDVSEIGLGCWQLGGDFGPIIDDRAHSIINEGLEQGINFFDTADVYGGGRSESYLGETLGNNKDVFLATKYGRDGNTYPDKYSLSDMRDSIKRAQDRLQRDVVDLLQLHCVPDEVCRQGDIFDCLRTVQQEGLISHFGCSVETIDEALFCAQQDGIASLQIIFNILRQRPIETLFEVVKENQVGIIVRLPLASGILSGKYNTATSFDESDHRNYNKDGAAFSVGETFSGVPFNRGLEMVEDIKAYKPDSITMAQFAMRWILDHDAVTTVIGGASSPEQVQSNASASTVAPLSKEVHDALYQYYVDKVESEIRGVR